MARLLGDITTIRGDLQNLDQFLADVELDRNMNILKESLIRHLYGEHKMKYKLRQPISHELQRYDFVSKKDYSEKACEVKCTTIVLYDVENPKSVWQFQLLQTQDTLDEESIVEVFNSAADMAQSLEYTNGRLTILFISEDNYRAFADVAGRAMDRLCVEDAGLAEKVEPMSVDVESIYTNLSYFLVDSEIWKVIDTDVVNT